jgi:hypothetical protein
MWGIVYFLTCYVSEEAIDALEGNHFSENEQSKDEQVASEGNDDHLLRHQR